MVFGKGVIGNTQLVSAELGSAGMVSLFALAGRDVHGYAITPDGLTVVFVADAAAQGTFELFRVPVDGRGPPPVRLNPALASNRDVSAFRLTPDGREVVYLADQRTAGVDELFVVPLDQSRPARRLSGPLGVSVADFILTSDGKRVVYRAGARFDLFSVPLAPSANR